MRMRQRANKSLSTVLFCSVVSFLSLQLSYANQGSLARPSVNLHGAFFLTPETGWVVGQLGKVFHTTDGGKSWQEQTSRTNLLLTAVDFTDQNNGWAVGERGIIFNTTDGGKSWKTQTSNVAYPLFDVDFIDNQKGWAVGHWGTILFTDDGGQHWHERSLSTALTGRGQIDPAAFTDIKDPASGEVLAKAGQLLSREDITKITARGISDAKVREDLVLNSVFFLDANHGWIAGEQGRVVRTEDGGQTWENVTLPRPPKQAGAGGDEELMSDEELEAFGALTPPPSLYGVYFVSPQQGWVVGQEGTIAKTEDGGRTWQFQPSGSQEALYDIGIKGDTGWIIGDKGAVPVSTTSGAQWEKRELGLEYRLSWLRRLAVTPSDQFFFVGADGLVLASGKSPDQGVWVRSLNGK